MGAAIVGVVGSLLGVLLGFIGQSLRARQERKLAMDTAKREIYAEFLRSISASYAQAKSEAKSVRTIPQEAKPSQSDTQEAKPSQSKVPEDANLLAATAAIELVADQTISKPARELSDRVICVHNKLRRDLSADEKDVPKVNEQREDLIKLFQKDLGILPGDQRVQRHTHIMGPPDPYLRTTSLGKYVALPGCHLMISWPAGISNVWP